MWKLLSLAALSLSIAPAPVASDGRGVRSVAAAQPAAASQRFDATQSAAIFVGVQTFADPTLAPVRYAVDDAIDLAFAFALDRKTSLVSPRRVVLALHGEPQKEESRARRNALEAAGATVVDATYANVLSLLEQQARIVGRDGIFIIAFATHGFTRGGVPYVLTVESSIRDPESALSTARVLEIAATSSARASLVFVDACRERLTATRSAGPQPQTAAPAIPKSVEGQVVFYAAAAGKYAYDDDRLRNGVFTAAVLEGLRCKAALDARGNITVETLSKYVERRVRSWVQRNRDRSARSAIQVNMDGETGAMPLASCQPPERLPQPARVDIAGATLTVIGDDGTTLWTHDLGRTIAHATAADLDGDARNEVIAATGATLLAFDASGERRWIADASAPANYDGVLGDLAIRALLVGDLFRSKQRQIVVIASGTNGTPSRLCIFEHDGDLRAAYWHPGRLQQVVIDRLTARHAPKLIVAAEDGVVVFDAGDGFRLLARR